MRSRLRLTALGATSALVLGLAVGLVSTPASATATCNETGFVKDGINLTAVLINPGNVIDTTVDAAGCNIGIYYGPGHSGHVSGDDVYGANYYGIVNNGGTVDVMNSSVHNIGETPFNGDQHGVGIDFALGAPDAGMIANNTVSQYQKGGIVVNGGSAQIQHNTVTGLGAVNFIAGNGIQIGYGATGTISNNTVDGNAYTGDAEASSAGILVFGGCNDYNFGGPLSTGVQIHNNSLLNNDMGIAVANYNSACTAQTSQPTNEIVHNNTLTNNHISNVSGNGYVNGSLQGYQAGIVDVGDGDQIHNNTISGIGYTPAQTTSSIEIVPIDTSLATNPKLHNNDIG